MFAYTLMLHKTTSVLQHNNLQNKRGISTDIESSYGRGDGQYAKLKAWKSNSISVQPANNQ